MFLNVLLQVVPGHKRAPSDASVASSEDDKVPATTSTLESVTEKIEAEPAEDMTSDKLSDEGLGTSEVDKAEEEKLNEVSDASNEDLATGLMEPTKALISEDSTEPKPEEAQAEEISAGLVVSQLEESLDTADTQEPVVVSQETEEGQAETQDKTTEDKSYEIRETEPEEVREEEKEEEKETSTVDNEVSVQPTESTDSEEQPKHGQDEIDFISGEVTQAEEETKGPAEDMPPQQVTEVTEAHVYDGINIKMNKSEDIESNLESNVVDIDINGATDTELNMAESSTDILVEKETTESELSGMTEEKPEDEALEEAEQSTQDKQAKEESELEDHTATESINGVKEEAKDTLEDLETVAMSKAGPDKEEEDKAAHEEESTHQDAVSVQESETESDTKTEQGSPAIMVKPDVEKDSDSGSSSAADSSSLDLNLSISSFLSKSKDGGSVSVQVNDCFYFCILTQINLINDHQVNTQPKVFSPRTSLLSFSGYQTSEEDSEEDTQVHSGWR